MVTFLDVSENSTNNTSTWDWVFSNGLTANMQNPRFTLATGQEIIATLNITTADNCTAMVQDTFFLQDFTIDFSDTQDE